MPDFKDPSDFRSRLAQRALQGVDTVAGPRNVDYGPPERDMAAVALMFTAYLRQRGLLADDASVESFDVPAMLDLVKTCRLAHKPGHADSIVDKIGWTLIYAECIDAKPKEWADACEEARQGEHE